MGTEDHQETDWKKIEILSYNLNPLLMLSAPITVILERLQEAHIVYFIEIQ